MLSTAIAAGWSTVLDVTRNGKPGILGFIAIPTTQEQYLLMDLTKQFQQQIQFIEKLLLPVSILTEKQVNETL